MRKLSTLIFILALGLSHAQIFAQDAMPSITNQQAKKFSRKISKTVSANYLLYLPKDYSPKGEQRWPLMLFLHGAGERGTNLSLVTVHGPPKIVKNKTDFPFILVSPQCPSNQSWSNDVLLALLDEVIKKYKVDESRVYLTGLSMGGFGTWSLGLTYPERFAAIAPICGGGETIGLLLADPKKARALKSLGVWAFHGAKDPVVPLDESQRMVDALKRLGNDPKFTIYPEAGHDSWTETYNNQDLYRWFLQHRR
jgi:predicted peptidase